MRIEPLEVYSRTTNSAIIKPPGRQFPGVVIQGDSLSILCGVAKNMAIKIRDGKTDHPDFPYEVEAITGQV